MKKKKSSRSSIESNSQEGGKYMHIHVNTILAQYKQKPVALSKRRGCERNQKRWSHFQAIGSKETRRENKRETHIDSASLLKEEEKNTSYATQKT